MTEPIVKVRENIVILFLALAGAFAVLLFAVFCFVGIYWFGETELIPVCVLLLMFMAIGAGIGIAYYFRRRIEFYQGYLITYPMFRKKKVIQYQDIQSISRMRERILLLDARGEVLAGFEDNMVGSEEALKYLEQYNRGENVSVDGGNEAKDERGWNPLRNSAFIASRWSEEQLDKEREWCKIISYLCAGLTVATFVFPLSDQFKQIFAVLILYFVLGMYFFFYPKMIFDQSKACDEYHFPFPMIAFCGSALLLVRYLEATVISLTSWLVGAGIITLILWIIFGIVMKVKRVKERIQKILLVGGACFIIAVYTAPTIVVFIEKVMG